VWECSESDRTIYRVRRLPSWVFPANGIVQTGHDVGRWVRSMRVAAWVIDLGVIAVLLD
jgi:hypothetical protein